MIYVCQTVLEKVDFESGLKQVFAGVPHAIFGSNTAYIYICGVKQFKNLTKRLVCIVDSFESRILLNSLVATFVESQFLDSIRLELFVDFSSVCPCNAVRWPDSSIFLK